MTPVILTLRVETLFKLLIAVCLPLSVYGFIFCAIIFATGIGVYDAARVALLWSLAIAWGVVTMALSARRRRNR